MGDLFFRDYYFVVGFGIVVDMWWMVVECEVVKVMDFDVLVGCECVDYGIEDGFDCVICIFGNKLWIMFS